jgi:hypothetical protein
MTRRIALPVLGLVLLWLSSCRNSQPEAKADPEKTTSVPAKRFHEEDPGRRELTEMSAKLAFDENKNAHVLIEFWENGQPSDRFARVDRQLRSPGGHISVAVHDKPAGDKSNTSYEIVIGDGLGPSPVATYDLPSGLKLFVSPIPEQVTLKNGAETSLCYVCIGKECELRPNESIQDLARRAEYAVVLNLKEMDKE